MIIFLTSIFDAIDAKDAVYINREDGLKYTVKEGRVVDVEVTNQKQRD